MAERAMTPEELRAHLEERHVATLVTVGRDGWPHAVPVWYAWRDDRLYVVTDARSVKARNIRRDPRVALCIAADGPPARYVMVEGRATVTRRDVRRWTVDMYVRYEGPDRGKANAETMLAQADMAVVVVEPTKVVTWVSGAEA